MLYSIVGSKGGLVERLVFVVLRGEEKANRDIGGSRIGVLLIGIRGLIRSSY